MRIDGCGRRVLCKVKLTLPRCFGRKKSFPHKCEEGGAITLEKRGVTIAAITKNMTMCVVRRV